MIRLLIKSCIFFSIVFISQIEAKFSLKDLEQKKGSQFIDAALKAVQDLSSGAGTPTSHIAIDVDGEQITIGETLKRIDRLAGGLNADERMQFLLKLPEGKAIHFQKLTHAVLSSTYRLADLIQLSDRQFSHYEATGSPHFNHALSAATERAVRMEKVNFTDVADLVKDSEAQRSAAAKEFREIIKTSALDTMKNYWFSPYRNSPVNPFWKATPANSKFDDTTIEKLYEVTELRADLLNSLSLSKLISLHARISLNVTGGDARRSSGLDRLEGEISKAVGSHNPESRRSTLNDLLHVRSMHIVNETNVDFVIGAALSTESLAAQKDKGMIGMLEGYFETAYNKLSAIEGATSQNILILSGSAKFLSQLNPDERLAFATKLIIANQDLGADLRDAYKGHDMFNEQRANRLASLTNSLSAASWMTQLTQHFSPNEYPRLYLSLIADSQGTGLVTKGLVENGISKTGVDDFIKAIKGVANVHSISNANLVYRATEALRTREKGSPFYHSGLQPGSLLSAFRADPFFKETSASRSLSEKVPLVPRLASAIGARVYSCLSALVGSKVP